MTQRDFSAELQAAREAQDWAAHERIWEERRVASVEADETALRDAPFVTVTYWHHYEQGAAILVEYNTRCEDCPTGAAMIVWQLGYWG